MDEKVFQEIALFRFSLIAPLVNDTHNEVSKSAYYRKISETAHKMDNGTSVKVSAATIKRWYRAYSSCGFDGLCPKVRNDKNKSRVLSAEAINKIVELKEAYPNITGKYIYKKLIEDGYIMASKTSLSTLLRFIKNNDLKTTGEKVERRAFEMEFADDCWQSDTCHGPIIKVDGHKRKTYLISFLDDASRLIVHAEFFLNDNAVNMQIAFKKAISKYGVPKKIYVDNGSPYKNEQLRLICANLGVILIHTPPYSPENKGKIERSFRTIKDGWLNGIDWHNYDENLHQLNNDLQKYLDENYNNSIHSAIKSTPKERYLRDYGNIRFLPVENLSDCFLHRISRRVNKDATIQINSITFEVPQKYIGEKIYLRYSPENLTSAYIFDDNKKFETVYPLKRTDNSKIKRNNIDYALIEED